MTEPAYRPLVRTQADLEQVWRQLMGPWGYGGHSLWLMFIEHDRPVPQLTQIEECGEPPDDRTTGRLAEVLAGVATMFGDTLRIAAIRTRPGADSILEDDRGWARSVYAACDRAGLPCETVHLGTTGSIRALPLDEVLPSSA